MSKRTKIWLMIAASLVIFGMLLFAAAMAGNQWDFAKLSTIDYETNTYQITEDFDHISMKTDTADIQFVRSEDGVCQVVCEEEKHAKNSASVHDGTLTIQTANEKAWYEYIGITLGTPQITIYLPDAAYGMLYIQESTGDVEIPQEFSFESIEILTSTGDVKSFASALGDIQIETSTGNIHVEEVSADMLMLSVSTGEVVARSISCEGDVNIDVSTGKTQLSDVTCRSMISNGSTGDFSCKNVIAGEMFAIERSTGDVILEACDAAEILIETSTGDVRGNFLSDKMFFTQTDTGSVNVPEHTAGGVCEIITTTGDIVFLPSKTE